MSMSLNLHIFACSASQPTRWIKKRQIVREREIKSSPQTAAAAKQRHSDRDRALRAAEVKETFLLELMTISPRMQLAHKYCRLFRPSGSTIIRKRVTIWNPGSSY